MQVTISREELLSGLQRVQGVIDTKGLVPILAHVLIEAKKEGVILTATNLDMGLRGLYAAQVKKPGTITLHAKKLYDIVKTATGETVKIETDDDDQMAQIACGKSKFKMMTMPAENFTRLPEFDEAKLVRLDTVAVAQMIRRTTFAISQEESRYTLNGMYLQMFEGEMRLVGTDGHRLAYVRRTEPTGIKGKVEVIIPKKCISELSRLLEGSEETLQFMALESDNQVVFKLGQQVFTSRLIEGAFPKYEDAIPKQSRYTATIDAASFGQSIKLVSTMADEKSRLVQFTFTKGKLNLSAKKRELGEGEDEIEVDYPSDDELKIGLNGTYILDVLSAIGSEKVVMSMNDPLSSVIIKSPDEENYTCLIMPMRLIG